MSSLKKPLRLVAMPLLFIAVGGVLASVRWNSGGSAADRIRLYDNGDVVRFLAQRQVTVGYYFNMRRNAEGNKLYISPYTDGSNQPRLIVVSQDKVESRPAPAKTVFLNRGEEYVVWTDDFSRGVEFKGGYRLELPRFALFDVDPSGEYFVLGEKPHSTWLGRVDAPEDRTLISRDILATRVFVQRGRIRICGFAFQTGRQRNAVEQIACCLTVTNTATGYETEERIDFPWAGGVVDVDPVSERLLLQGASDMFTRQHVYDFQTKKKKSLGRARNWGFFLSSNSLSVK